MKKFNGFSSEEWNQIKLNLFSRDYLKQKDNLLIAEKLRKFCSFYGKNLIKESKKRFKNRATLELENIMEILLFCTNKKNFNYFSNHSPIDQAYLNAALYCSDALSKLNSKKTNSYNISLKELMKSLISYLLLNKESIEDKKISHDKFFNEFKKLFT